MGINTNINWYKVNNRGTVYIRSSVCIEPGVTIAEPSQIGHDTNSRAVAKIPRSELFRYTRIAFDMNRDRMINSPEYSVDGRGNTLYRGNDALDLRWTDARA